jgi:hypothetical protein
MRAGEVVLPGIGEAGAEAILEPLPQRDGGVEILDRRAERPGMEFERVARSG